MSWRWCDFCLTERSPLLAHYTGELSGVGHFSHLHRHYFYSIYFTIVSHLTYYHIHGCRSVSHHYSLYNISPNLITLLMLGLSIHNIVSQTGCNLTPWCWTLTETFTLTLNQIWNLYLLLFAGFWNDFLSSITPCVHFLVLDFTFHWLCGCFFTMSPIM